MRLCVLGLKDSREIVSHLGSRLDGVRLPLRGNNFVLIVTTLRQRKIKRLLSCHRQIVIFLFF